MVNYGQYYIIYRRSIFMKIGFIGSGNMAAAIIRGMVAYGTDAKSVYISDID
jgi:pyrroline-5-carboxylate reductase